MPQIAVKDKNGNIMSLPALEAHEAVKSKGAVYVPKSVLKAVETGISEEVARKTPWPKLQKMIAKARAPKKHVDEDE